MYAYFTPKNGLNTTWQLCVCSFHLPSLFLLGGGGGGAGEWGGKGNELSELCILFLCPNIFFLLTTKNRIYSYIHVKMFKWVKKLIASHVDLILITNSTTYTCLLRACITSSSPKNGRSIRNKNSKIANSKDLPHHGSQKTRTRNYFLFYLALRACCSLSSNMP